VSLAKFVPINLMSQCGIGRSASAAALLLMSGGSASAKVPNLPFDRVFPSANEPASLHFQVVFVSNRAVHRMEIWRDRSRRVKRVTDKDIVSLATHRAGDTGYQLTILDLKRRIATQIDRTNLYRVGNFTDWFDLTHGLRHPKGAYTLSASTAPAGMPTPVASCAWYRLTEGPRKTSICWDARNHVPLLIASADHHPIWRVVQIDTKPPTASTFAMDIRGFTVNDANRDIERD